MRIAIDLLVAEKERGGLLTAAIALLEGLKRVDQANEYIIITGRPREYLSFTSAPNIRTYAVKLWTWRGILIQHQLLLPDILRKIQPDILHVPAFSAPIGWNGPLVLTVHDLAFLTVPDQSSLYARLYWKYLLHESVRRAQRIIAISEQTRSELITSWSVEAERIRLIHNALRPSLRYTDIPPGEILSMRQRYGGRYLLHVGRVMPRKNVGVLIEAFNVVAPLFEDLQLVLTGGTGYDSAEILRKMKASPYRERMYLAGWVTDKNLGAIYAGAEALVFPSRHEGFGLPTVEAMACGTPVIASHEAASMEIAGDAVVRVDCSDPAPLAGAIVRVLTDEALRDRLIQLGKAQAATFTIEACASATLAVYRDVVHYDASPDSSPPETSPDAVEASSAEAELKVSVIVPVARPELGAQALESLSKQHYTGELETIVVGACADDLAQRWKIVSVNRGPVRDPGKARNLGAMQATGDVLIFLDDDCTVEEDWVKQNVQALKQPGVGMIGARIRGKSQAFFARCTDFTNFGDYQHGRPLDIPIAAASMAVHRKIFEAVGGFDETKHYGEDEDIDLCYRIQQLGYRTVYQPDIVVTHNHRRDTFRKILRHNYTHGKDSGLITKLQYQKLGWKNRLLARVRFPLVFLILLPCIALAATARIVLLNIRTSGEVLRYVPVIFLAKLAYEFGIFQRLLFKRPRYEALTGDNSPRPFPGPGV
jgi:glycosyltransferase involved in cell wall biosynthesis/GT2 family glycosyltransferase